MDAGKHHYLFKPGNLLEQAIFPIENMIIVSRVLVASMFSILNVAI
ncbi:hypothetical protein NB311A_13816 [Nitrobacter sp. Nb-311A]|nr:hypothetical protein NB311A_13816 [Nitrobacter sp. Nb-311A]